MTRFIAGILCALAVQAIGWPAIERTLTATGDAVQRVAKAALKELPEPKKAP